MQTSDISVFQCFSLFGYWAVISTVAVSLGNRKMSFELMYLLLSSLRVIRLRKKSELAPLHVVFNLSNGKCVFLVTKSFSYSDIGKCLSVGVVLLSDRNRCVISCLCMCKLYQTVSVSRLATGVFFTVLYTAGMESDVFWFFSRIHSSDILYISNEWPFSVFESSRLYLLQKRL